MNSSAFEDLILRAMERPDKAVCSELTKAVEAMKQPLSEDVSGKLELLWEGWSGALSDVQASFCVVAATCSDHFNPVHSFLQRDNVSYR